MALVTISLEESDILAAHNLDRDYQAAAKRSAETGKPIESSSMLYRAMLLVREITRQTTRE